jgi:hypothetical protein
MSRDFCGETGNRLHQKPKIHGENREKTGKET